jgi:hypothetical protein
VTEIALDCPENLGIDSAISQAAEFPEHTHLIDQMCSLFIVGQIRSDPLLHDHNECAVIHVHPIAPTNKLVRSVPYEWTIGIDR